jgi:hypothetical protein
LQAAKCESSPKLDTIPPGSNLNSLLASCASSWMVSNPSREIRSDDSSRTRGNNFLTTDPANRSESHPRSSGFRVAQHFSAAVSTLLLFVAFSRRGKFRPAEQFFRSLCFQHRMPDLKDGRFRLRHSSASRHLDEHRLSHARTAKRV